MTDNELYNYNLIIYLMLTQAIVAAMKGVVECDESAVTESLKEMKKSLESIIASMDTLKS